MEIRSVGAGDRDGWERLYRGYARFYRREIDGGMLDRLWGWLRDETHVVEGLVAEQDGALVGLAHYRAMPSPLRAREICYLDDLFVDPSSRGAGVGAALIARVGEIAGRRGWPLVRWLTRDDNYRARGLYDRVSACTDWRVYEMAVD